MIYIKNARIVSGAKQLDETELLIENGRIKALGKQGSLESEAKNCEVRDLKGQMLAPAFIDIQINGGSKTLFTQKPTAETIEEMSQICRHYATPYFFPTLVSSPLEVVYQAVDAVREAQKTNPNVIGMHLEGPFLSKKKKGAHNEEVICKPTMEMLKKLVEYAQGAIKLITLAPENCTMEQINYLRENGIQVSLGHSSSNYELAQECFAEGVNIVTHLYNAMSGFTHRSPGLAGAALENDSVYTPLILDGGHCHWASARLAYKLKGEKLILITDAAILGRGLKEIPFDGLHAILGEDGFYRNPDGALAGSAISLCEAIYNAVEHLGVSIEEAIEMTTGRVAKAIGMEDKIGAIAEGYPAIFALHNDEKQDFELLDLSQG